MCGCVLRFGHSDRIRPVLGLSEGFFMPLAEAPAPAARARGLPRIGALCAKDGRGRPACGSSDAGARDAAGGGGTATAEEGDGGGGSEGEDELLLRSGGARDKKAMGEDGRYLSLGVLKDGFFCARGLSGIDRGRNGCGALPW